MNIGLDISSLVYGRGVSRYTSNLLSALSKLPAANIFPYASTWRGGRELTKALDIALNDLDKEKRAQILSQTVIKKTPPQLKKILWHNFHLDPVKKDLPQIEVFHSWDYMQPPDKNLPLVSTIHDLAILKYPHTAHPNILRAHKQSWQILKDKGAQIITVSKSTQQDIINYLDFPEYQVTVIHEAVPRETIELSRQMTVERYEELKLTLKLDRSYVLFVGTKEPRKNLQRLIKAWQPLSNDIDLLIVGAQGWDNDTLSKQPTVRFLENINDEALTVLYHNASVLAYPSLDEGFGLPILEAFYFGVPVVTSDLSAMKEIAGSAAILVDPFSIESIKNGLIKAITLSGEDKQALETAMSTRLANFSWEKCAAQTLQVYQKAFNYA